MKKIIFVTLPGFIIFSLFVFSVFWGGEVRAQNIGSLKDVVSPGFSFKKDLQQGDVDPDVIELQRVLNSDTETRLLTMLSGSSGKEASYFDALTKAAVIKFQEKYREMVLTPTGLTSGTGFVGRATRTKLNLLVGVLNTADSSGLPEKSGVVDQNTVTADVSSTSGSIMTTGSLVELLIDIGAIAPEKAAQARLFAEGKSALEADPGTDPVDGEVVSLVSSVDIKIGLGEEMQDFALVIDFPQDVNVSWTSVNVSTCTMDSAPVALSGASTVNVTTTKEFKVVCTNAAGDQVVDAIWVILLGQAATVPTTDIKADGQDGLLTITSARNVTISWTSANVDSCSINGSNKGLNGSYTTKVSASKSFRITCTGPNGTATGVVWVVLDSSSSSGSSGGTGGNIDTDWFGGRISETGRCCQIEVEEVCIKSTPYFKVASCGSGYVSSVTGPIGGYVTYSFAQGINVNYGVLGTSISLMGCWVDHNMSDSIYIGELLTSGTGSDGCVN